MYIYRVFPTLVVFVSALVITNQSIFFSFMGLMGIDYEGSESSNIYIFYLLILFFLTITFYFYTVISKRFARGEFIALSIILFFITTHLLWVLFDPIETRIVPMFMIYSFVLGFVGLFSALAIVKFGLLNELIKITELIFIIQAIGIASYSVLNTLSGNKVAVLAGATYQALSYYSAFTMGMLVLYNFIISEKLRYAFLSSFIFRFLSILLIISCVLAVFIGGGRGAFLLMSAYFVFAVYVVFIRNTLRRGRVVKFYFYSVLVFGVVVCFISFFGQQDFVKSGYKRATAFITSEGVDLGKGSSGRDEVYSTTFEYIYKKPIIGYGPFGVRDKTIHAHNVFLELWLQFGALFLFVFPFVLFFVYFKLKKIDSNYRVWLIFLFLYPMINIQFSSAYTTSSVLWFVLGVLILSNTLCINNINKENFNETCECS